MYMVWGRKGLGCDDGVERGQSKRYFFGDFSKIISHLFQKMNNFLKLEESLP